jgi:iron complex outermembrane receptor protein
LASLVVCNLCCRVVLADEARTSARRHIDVPRQALGHALRTLMKEHDIQLVYRAELVQGRMTEGARGELTAIEALDQLLNGTDLTYIYIDENTLTLLPVGGSGGREKAGGNGDRTGPSESAPDAHPPQGAQDPGQSPDIDADTEPIGEIRVTGTRLVVPPGFQSPAPMTVVDEAELEARVPTSLSDSLNQLPVFRDSHTPASNGISTVGSVGQSFLNLRGLGPARTLVLLDGRRIVPSTSAGMVDVSILPEPPTKRVDIVTGGVSAVYGSDAVAGVVNFVLDDRFEGIKLTAQTGQAAAGDARVRKFELGGGIPLFNGRGHLVGSTGYFSDSGIATWRDRDWFNSCARIANPDLVPSSIMACNVHSAAFTPGGLIPGGPLKGIEFGPGGVPRQFNYGTQATTLTMIGGDGQDHGENLSAVPEVKRQTAFAHLTYDLTPDFSFFVEGLYGEARVHFVPLSPWEGQSTGFTIFDDNAFLPEAIRQRMAEENITSFPLWRFSYDFGPVISESRNRTTSGAVGFEATVGGWTVDAYLQQGRNNYLQTTQNNPKINLLYNAADAIVGPDGRIVCRSTLVNPDNGCVPLNLFGPGAPSAAAKEWLLGTTFGDQTSRQDVFNFSVSGKPWRLPAGPVSVAFGGGYRRESSHMVVDPISTTIRRSTGDYKGFPAAIEGLIGGWERTNVQPVSGEYDLTELFAETLVPWLDGVRGAQSLELSLAARLTDYSTSGDVTTWKVGLTWEPTHSIRFRGTASRDIRAANISELFSGPSLGQGNLIDPFHPPGSPERMPVVYTRPQGNPNLTPEKADTRTVGVIVQPTFLPGLSVSLDFYDIEIKDAIGTLSGQVIVDQCFEGATSLCPLLTRDPTTGILTAVDAPYLNLSLRKTRGYDLEMVYQKEFSSGSLTLRGLASYVDTLTTLNPGAPEIESAGQTGRPGTGGIPNLVANASAQFRSQGGYGAYLQVRYIDEGLNDATLAPEILDPASNRVASVTYTDVTLTRRIGKLVADSSAPWGAELFVTVNNVFDREPPSAPSPWLVFGAPNGGTNGAVFDLIGRRYNAGIRMQF